MASLVEELVNVLEAEKQIYTTLVGYEERKKDVLIAADVATLEEITTKEQLAGDDLIAYSNKQIQILKDIATVLGRTDGKMTVTRLISLLDTQPKVQEQLTEARDSLLTAANQMKTLSDQNAILIRQAIELNEFDMTLFKSLRQAPETANYDKSAYNTGSLLGGGGFDATS
ncbi:MAG: flagellar protein FlgN [Agathobacter sp.]|nr:flagellar protein FlgN [Agathobacter sp.]